MCACSSASASKNLLDLHEVLPNTFLVRRAKVNREALELLATLNREAVLEQLSSSEWKNRMKKKYMNAVRTTSKCILYIYISYIVPQYSVPFTLSLILCVASTPAAQKPRLFPKANHTLEYYFPSRAISAIYLSPHSSLHVNSNTVSNAFQP